MIKKWLRGLIGLSALALLGRLLGFVREVLMASKFGASEITDAYLMTLLLFDIAIAANSSILSGTLSYSSGVKSLTNFSKSLYKIGLKIFASVFVVAIILYSLADKLIPLMFSKSGQSTQIVIESSQLFLILSAFLVASGVFSAFLQIKGNITNPGQLVIFLNVVSVLFLILFTKYFGIIALPLGLLLGGVLFFLYQTFLIKKIKLEPSGNYEKDEFSLLGWGAVIFLVFGNSLLPSLTGLLERYFAYFFTEGTFSYYQYATKIILLPLTILSFAISTSLLPIQTKLINEGNKNEFMDVTNNGIILSVVTSAFFALIFFTLPQPITQLIYHHGHFNLRDTVETSFALQIMSIGLIPFLLNPILGNIFYSLRAIKPMIVINLFFIAIKAAALFFLSKTLSGIETLTITWTVIVWINNIVLIYYLVRFKNLHFNHTISLKLSLILLITIVLVFLSKDLIGLCFADINLSPSSWSILVKLVCIGSILLLLFGLAAGYVFRNQISKILTNLKHEEK